MKRVEVLVLLIAAPWLGPSKLMFWNDVNWLNPGPWKSMISSKGERKNPNGEKNEVLKVLLVGWVCLWPRRWPPKSNKKSFIILRISIQNVSQINTSEQIFERSTTEEFPENIFWISEDEMLIEYVIVVSATFTSRHFKTIFSILVVNTSFFLWTKRKTIQKLSSKFYHVFCTMYTSKSTHINSC